MADYVVFPYKQTRESASAAVTIGLATLKPVLVSPLPIFSDLGDCTWRMAGEGVQEIVDAVCTLENDPGQAEKLLARQHEWLAERSWSRISARLDAVIDGLLLDRQLETAITDRRTQFLAASEEAPAEEAQLLVDVSELLFRDARTGIQRVVRSILGELLAAPPKGFRVRPIYGTAERAYRYTDKFTPGIGQNNAASNEQAVKVRAGDVFLGLDLSAHLFPRAEAELRAFRLAGVRIHFVVYDIIPLRYPQFAVAGLRDAFDTWLHALARHQTADGRSDLDSPLVRAWSDPARKALAPLLDWASPDVVAINTGITLVMAENLRSGLVWRTFMRAPEVQRGLRLAGLVPRTSHEGPAILATVVR